MKIKSAKKIVESLRRSGLSAIEIGKKVGVSRIAVWKWENGGQPTMEHYRSLAELDPRK